MLLKTQGAHFHVPLVMALAKVEMKQARVNRSRDTFQLAHQGVKQ